MCCRRKKDDHIDDIYQERGMIRITEKSKCCGCTACMNICPVQCIVMRRDREGFDYPVANPDRCISCGRCDNVCPMSNEPAAISPSEVLAARNTDYMKGSSSGGVFPALAMNVVGGGGVVYGAVMNSDLVVSHTDAEDMDGVEKMRGSKYVQSELYASFEDVKAFLEEGRKVMFTGTPCQIAGLKSYLGKDYPQLLTVDFACHGVPSPGLWEKYVKALGVKCGIEIEDIRFRGKDRSWRQYDFVMKGGGGEVVIPHQKDSYMLLFLQDMTLRPSCYKCGFRSGSSGSDLRLADLWNVTEAAPELDDDKGVSLVLAYTGIGREALYAAQLDMRKIAPETAYKRNSGFVEVAAVPEKRAEFFKGYNSADDLIRYMEGFVVKKYVVSSFYRRLHTALSKLKGRLIR